MKIVKFIIDSIHPGVNGTESARIWNEYYYHLISIEQTILVGLLWHIFPISLERALLLYKSYKNEKCPTFIVVILVITVCL